MLMGSGPHRGFRVPPRSVHDIRNAAVRLRSIFGIDGPQFDAERVLENLTSFSITLDVVDDDDPELPRGVEACWVPDTVTLIVRQSVYRAACRRERRALFTIAHEFGHLALGHRRAFNRDTRVGNFKTYEDSEWQADTFAGEFLMPLDLIKKNAVTRAADIAHLFGASAQAAETRFNKLQKKGEI